MRAHVLVAASFVLAAACDEGQPYDIGTSEPIQVRVRASGRAGTFHRDALPDVPLEDGGATELPLVTKIETITGNAVLGQTGKTYIGRASPHGYSIGVGIPSLFDGYWTVPLGSPDPTANGELGYEILVDFARDIPPGNYEMAFVAFDEGGNPGPRTYSTTCIVPDIADNLNACFPTRAPADTIITLDWDTNADLDLVVVTPSGKVVSAKRPTTATADGGITAQVLNDPSTGRLTRDSNAACEIDGARRESLVFTGEPPEGEYQIYVSFFHACGQSNVRFHTRLFRAHLNDDGTTYRTEREELVTGQLVALQANRGVTNGTLAGVLTLP